MPSYSLQYQHNGSLFEILLPADNLDDAHARLESLKASAELDDCEVIAQIHADDSVVAWAQVRNEALKEIGHD